jgi:ureidoglycolate hydrolase
MSAQSDALAAAYATLEDHAGQTVTYARGAASASLTAVPGQSDFETIDQDGTSHTARQVDWLITASALILSGAQTEPAAGEDRKSVG